MSRPRRLLTALACAAGACALSAPAALAASAPANGRGTILSSGGHTLRLVGRDHRVADVHVRSARGLRRGDVVKVRKGRARVSGHVRRVAFLGRVVRNSGKGAVVRLSDGSTFKVGARKPHRHGRKARSAGSVTIDFQGLASGQTLLITIATDARGNVALTIKLLPAGTSVGAGDVELHASGVVTDDEGDGWFAIDPGDGDELGFDDPQRRFEDADAAWCDVVAVTYHRDGDALVADDVQVTGQSDSGDCAEEWADEVDGTVTAIASDASTLTVAPDDGGAATTIPVDDPELLDGIEVGDDVAVTLDEDGVAIDVELLDWADDGGDE